MIINLIVLILLVATIGAVDFLDIGSFSNIGQEAALVFGFILIASYICGRLARRARTPMITGYLLAGLFFGPHIMGAISPSLRFLTPKVLDELSIFNSIALGLIAFSAGGELKIDSLRSRMKSILAVTAGQGLVAFVIIVPAIFMAASFFTFLSGMDTRILLAVGILFSVVALANSPTTTIAIIIEYKAKGALTTTALGVTVFKDVMVIILFSLAMIAAKILCTPDVKVDLSIMGLLLWEVAGSVAIGLGLGFLIKQYMKYVGRELPLIMLALSFLAMEMARDFHLSGLLICMITGFYIENYTDKGKMLLAAIERYSLPIFVLFFTITGAQLQIPMLLKVWPFVLLMVILRALAIYIGTKAGTLVAGDSPMVRSHLWLAFLAQAGVTLGFANLIGQEIPGAGPQVSTIIISAVAINQIIGPVAFRFGLLKSGEARMD